MQCETERAGMRRWFLSYNAQDLALAQTLEAALRGADPESTIFFAPKSLRAGSYWLPKLADEIAAATVVILLVGERGIGRWQVDEYYEAARRRRAALAGGGCGARRRARRSRGLVSGA